MSGDNRAHTGQNEGGYNYKAVAMIYFGEGGYNLCRPISYLIDKIHSVESLTL